MKCFVNFVNQDNGEEDAYKIIAVPAEAEQKMDKEFDAAHSLLIVVKDGTEEVFSLHAD